MAAAPAEPFGTVVSNLGVNIRQFPTADSSVIGTLPEGARVGLRAKARAQNIDGNEIWYLLRDRKGWVAARFVANTGTVKLVKDVEVPEAVTAAVGAADGQGAAG
ncbi:SH3 domain-containing protein [Kitasatospora sp. NPDC054939]